MMPYGSDIEDYWAGYFTSRALAKKMDRDASSALNAHNTLYSLKMLDQQATDSELQDILKVKDNLLDIMGVFQHHDAITGTAKQAVADNYQLHISTAVNDSSDVFMKYVNDMAQAQPELVAEGVGEFKGCTMAQDSSITCYPAGDFKSDDTWFVMANNPSTVPVDFVYINEMSADLSYSV